MRKIIALGIVCLSLLSVVACSTIEEQFTDVPKDVAEAQASLATLETSAKAYLSLPVCGATGAVLCRNPAITKQIMAADNTAFNAIEAAHTAETQDTLDAAGTALSALQAIVSSPTVTTATATTTAN